MAIVANVQLERQQSDIERLFAHLKSVNSSIWNMLTAFAVADARSSFGMISSALPIRLAFIRNIEINRAISLVTYSNIVKKNSMNSNNTVMVNLI